MRRLLFPALVLTLASTSPALSHEFWIEPRDYRLDPGAPAVARLYVGQRMTGISYFYNPAQFARFDLVQGDRVVPVPGRVGDDPALDMVPPGPGLWTVVHQTAPLEVFYRDWSKFVGFVEEKDFPGVLESHAARGLPETGFRESYTRFAKALIAVGDGAGADAEVGMLTEIVAETNPFADDLSGGMTLRVLYQGAPRAGVQLELFARAADGGVEITRHRTDAAGRVTVPVRPGVEYLADAVVMRPLPNDDPGAGPVWESLWAALTFRVPG